MNRTKKIARYYREQADRAATAPKARNPRTKEKIEKSEEKTISTINYNLTRSSMTQHAKDFENFDTWKKSRATSLSSSFGTF